MTRRIGVTKAYAENPIESLCKNSAENLAFTISKKNMRKTVDYCMAHPLVMRS